jgi:hypothetical protein
VTNATHRLLEEALTLEAKERAELAAELLASLCESGNDEQTIRAAETAARPRTATESRCRVELDAVNEWPKRFFEEVVGGWQGDPLERPEQGHAEHRDRL